jgi:hypothetical protein
MIDPRGMTLIDWVDSVILVVNDAWAFGRVIDENDWQKWALGFLNASPFSTRAVPDPFQFDDWREWAMRVYPMLEKAG